MVEFIKINKDMDRYPRAFPTMQEAFSYGLATTDMDNEYRVVEYEIYENGKLLWKQKVEGCMYAKLFNFGCSLPTFDSRLI